MTTTDSGSVQTLAEQVTVLAAGTTWKDMMINFFYDWKIIIAILALVIIGSAGVWMMGKARIVGVAMMIGSVFVAAFFLNIERFVQISDNQVHEWDRPAKTSDPFNRS